MANDKHSGTSLPTACKRLCTVPRHFYECKHQQLPAGALRGRSREESVSVLGVLTVRNESHDSSKHKGTPSVAFTCLPHALHDAEGPRQLLRATTSPQERRVGELVDLCGATTIVRRRHQTDGINENYTARRKRKKAGDMNIVIITANNALPI